MADCTIPNYLKEASNAFQQVVDVEYGDLSLAELDFTKLAVQLEKWLFWCREANKIGLSDPMNLFVSEKLAQKYKKELEDIKAYNSGEYFYSAESEHK